MGSLGTSFVPSRSSFCMRAGCCKGSLVKMALADLQAAWREELRKGASSPLAHSPAFREALAAGEARTATVGRLLAGWHSVGPSFPRSRFTRAQRLGLAYERRVLQVLLPVVGTLGWTLRDHEWFLTAQDSWCQPDFFLESPGGGAILLEAKLTFTVEGMVQLARYRREIQAVTGIQAVPVMVCKNLLRGCPKVVGEFEEIEGGCVWHLP